MDAGATKANGVSATVAKAVAAPDHGPTGVNREAARRLKNIAGQCDGVGSEPGVERLRILYPARRYGENSF